MKQIINLLLCLPFIILLSGCPMGNGTDSPCPEYDTLYFALDSNDKKEIIYKGYEILKFVDVNTFDTIIFKGGPVIHGFDTIANTLNPGPEQYCDQIVILEYVKVKFTNINFEFEFFETKISPKLFERYSDNFYPNLIINASGEDYFKSLLTLCNGCFSLDSVFLNNKKYYKVYKIYLYGFTTAHNLLWNKQEGVLNFPVGIINNRNMVLHSVTR